MNTAKRSPLVQVYNEMHGLIVGVGKNYCHKSKALCEQCPLQGFLLTRRKARRKLISPGKLPPETKCGLALGLRGANRRRSLRL